MPTSSSKRTNKSRNGTPAEKDTSKLIRESMKCPVCLETLLPPIYQCETGHNICYQCVEEVTECPLCKSDYGETRNYLAEELVNSMQFPCKYEEFGCHKTFLGSELKEHQENCECQPYRCPELACHELVGIHQMSKHLDKHGFKVMKGDVHQASVEILDDHFDRKTEYNPWRISAFNTEFYTVSTRSRDGTWYFWTYGLGQQKDLKKFSHEIVLFSEEKQIMYRGSIQSLTISPEDTMKGGNCMIVTDSVIKSLRKSGRIKCQVYIIQGKNWDNCRRALPSSDRLKAKRGTKYNLQQNKPKKNNRVLVPNSFSVINSSPSLRGEQLIRQSKSRVSQSNDRTNNNYIENGPSKKEESAARNRGPANKGNCPLKPSQSSTTRSSRCMSSPSAVRTTTVSDEESALVKKIRETLRCTGCNDVISPPIFLCAIGHNVCHKCKLSRQDCSLCRAPLSEARNYFAEELLYKTYQRCIYFKHGCGVCLPSAQMKAHEGLCSFAPFECPFNVCRTMLRAYDMLDHLRSHLITSVHDELKGEAIVPRSHPRAATCTIPNILFVEKVPFYPIILRETDGSFLFYVIAHKNTKYRFQVLIKKNYKTIAYQGLVLSLRSTHSQVKQKGLALVANEKTVKSFKSNDKIDYQIKIFKVEPPEVNCLKQSSLAFRSSWVLSPKNGELVTKAELYANKKTSVSPDDDSDEEDEDTTNSTPVRPGSGNSTETESVGSFSEADTEVDSDDDEDKSHEDLDTDELDLETMSETSKKSCLKKKRSKEATPTLTQPEEPALVRTTKSKCGFTKQAKLGKAKAGHKNQGDVPSNLIAALPTIKSATFIIPWKYEATTQSEASSFMDMVGKEIESSSCSTPTRKDAINIPCDVNNNTGPNGPPKVQESPQTPSTDGVPPLHSTASVSIHSLKMAKEGSILGQKSSSMISNPTQQSSEKNVKNGKRARSECRNRVRLSHDVVCSGGPEADDTNSDCCSNSGSASRSHECLKKSMGRKRSTGPVTCISRHMVTTEEAVLPAASQSYHAPPNPTIVDTKNADKEFGQLQMALDDNDNVMDETDMLSVKNLNEMTEAVIEGGFHVVKSVYNLFAAASDGQKLEED